MNSERNLTYAQVAENSEGPVSTIPISNSERNLTYAQVTENSERVGTGQISQKNLLFKIYEKLRGRADSILDSTVR